MFRIKFLSLTVFNEAGHSEIFIDSDSDGFFDQRFRTRLTIQLLDRHSPFGIVDRVRASTPRQHSVRFDDNVAVWRRLPKRK